MGKREGEEKERKKIANILAPQLKRDYDKVKVNWTAELDKFEASLEKLKVEYEHYFLALNNSAPEKFHKEIVKRLRELTQMPFKTQASSFRLKTLDGRYHTYNTYWQRVLKEREAGTYSKDTFKADLREKTALEEQFALTAAGIAEGALKELYKSYKNALEKTSGNKQAIDYQSFQKSIINRAREFREKHPDRKMSFSVVVTKGKVSVKARLK
ncbi:MAG TPA: MXAN_5187 C-terminal domain-containing protein [Oligoflexia bacterium]|nr:MXAN_5187 C-terminal domain-containing protein [Oligoflexia bacterium]HMP26903.1 MXAN_5187 C-terminal domain-containing protein [Oligoflexia bacterium]